MEKNDSFENEDRSNEATLDFDFDEIPEEEFDFGEEMDSDADTIDLDNIVEDDDEGTEGDEQEDIESLLDDDPFASEETEDDLDLSSALKELEDAAEEDIELELSEGDVDELEEDTGLEGSDLGDLPVEEEVEITLEEEEVTTDVPSSEEPSLGPSLAEKAPEGAPSPPPAGEVQISEEKLEAVVTRVVENVVERVAKDTMANVADKVIRETIEMLKESIDRPEK